MRISPRSLVVLTLLSGCADDDGLSAASIIDGGISVQDGLADGSIEASMRAYDALARCYPVAAPASEPARSLRSAAPPTDAVAWQPPPLPAYEGPLAPNQALSAAERIGEAQLSRAEDVAFDAEGRLYTGSDDGTIYRAAVEHDGRVSAVTAFAHVGSRALGLAFDACGNLVAAVPERGIVAVNPDGLARTIADRVDGTSIAFADELAIARDGTIYVTEASTKYDAAWPYEFLEGRPHGRVLAFEPTTGQVHVVASTDLYFPNGILVADDETHVLVAETLRGRISRHWLRGSRAGEAEPFAENLPLIPDNIARDARGRLWVTGLRRTATLDAISASAEMRMQLLQLPLAQLTAASPVTADPYRLVVVLGVEGAIVESLHDATGSLPPLSAAVPRDGYVYLGTNVGQGIARVPMP